MQNIVKKFNETNGKGITVVAEEQPWDGGAYSNNLLNACIGGGGPDVATFKLTSTPAFVENKLLADLTDMINGAFAVGAQGVEFDLRQQAGVPLADARAMQEGVKRRSRHSAPQPPNRLRPNRWTSRATTHPDSSPA